MIRVVIRGRKCSDEPSYVRIGGRAIIKKDGSYLFSYLTARNEYLNAERYRRQRGDLFIVQILDEEIKPDDSRLR